MYLKKEKKKEGFGVMYIDDLTISQQKVTDLLLLVLYCSMPGFGSLIQRRSGSRQNFSKIINLEIKFSSFDLKRARWVCVSSIS